MKITLSSFYVLACVGGQFEPEGNEDMPIRFDSLSCSAPDVNRASLVRFISERWKSFKCHGKVPFKADPFIREEVKKFVLEFDRRVDFDSFLEKLNQKIEKNKAKLGANHLAAENFMELLQFAKGLPDMGNDLKKFTVENIKELGSLRLFRNYDHLIKIYEILKFINKIPKIFFDNDDFIVAMINYYSNQTIGCLKHFNVMVLFLPYLGNESKETRRFVIQKFIDSFRKFLSDTGHILSEKKSLGFIEVECPEEIFDLVRSIALCQHEFNILRYFLSGFRNREYGIIFKKQLIEDSLSFIAILGVSYDDFVHRLAPTMNGIVGLGECGEDKLHSEQESSSQATNNEMEVQ